MYSMYYHVCKLFFIYENKNPDEYIKFTGARWCLASKENYGSNKCHSIQTLAKLLKNAEGVLLLTTRRHQQAIEVQEV